MFIVDKYLYARCWDTAVNRTNTICTAPNLTDSWVNTQGHLRKSEGVPGKNKYPHQGLNWLSIYFVQDRVPLGVRSRTSCQSGSLAVSEVQTRGRHDWCWELRIISSQEDGSPEDGSLEGNTGLYKHNNLELNFKSDEQNQKPAAQWIGTGCRGKKLKCVWGAEMATLVLAWSQGVHREQLSCPLQDSASIALCMSGSPTSLISLTGE